MRRGRPCRNSSRLERNTGRCPKSGWRTFREAFGGPSMGAFRRWCKVFKDTGGLHLLDNIKCDLEEVPGNFSESKPQDSLFRSKVVFTQGNNDCSFFFFHMSFCRHIFLFLLHKQLGMEIMDCIVSAYLIMQQCRAVDFRSSITLHSY